MPNPDDEDNCPFVIVAIIYPGEKERPHCGAGGVRGRLVLYDYTAKSLPIGIIPKICRGDIVGRNSVRENLPTIGNAFAFHIVFQLIFS